MATVGEVTPNPQGGRHDEPLTFRYSPGHLTPTQRFVLPPDRRSTPPDACRGAKNALPAALAARRAPASSLAAHLRPSCSTTRSEEHTSELQSRSDLVCRLLLEKKKTEK